MFIVQARIAKLQEKLVALEAAWCQTRADTVNRHDAYHFQLIWKSKESRNQTSLVFMSNWFLVLIWTEFSCKGRQFSVVTFHRWNIRFVTCIMPKCAVIYVYNWCIFHQIYLQCNEVGLLGSKNVSIYVIELYEALIALLCEYTNSY